MKRQVIGLLVIALLLAGSVSASSKKLGEGDRSFFYYLYEDFTLENAEGKKLTYKDTEFSGDMDYMVSGNTSTEGSVVIPDSEYYIFEANGDQAIKQNCLCRCPLERRMSGLGLCVVPMSKQSA